MIFCDASLPEPRDTVQLGEIYWNKYEYGFAGFAIGVGLLVLVRGDFFGLVIIAIGLFPYFWPRLPFTPNSESERIMDWIDEEKQRRLKGVNTPILPSQHAAVNARYPGTTLEYCCRCDNPTGRAGPADDSIYFGDLGPYCWDCRNEIQCPSCEGRGVVGTAIDAANGTDLCPDCGGAGVLPEPPSEEETKTLSSAGRERSDPSLPKPPEKRLHGKE